MAFKVKGFDQEFETIVEYEEAERLREQAEESINEISTRETLIKVTATVIPATKETLEKAITNVEATLSELTQKIDGLLNVNFEKESPGVNKQGLVFGLTLMGESKGKSYTLDIIEEGYLCSDGKIYESLSGAALGVSGNRRSGWKFWRDSDGEEIGKSSGRFRECTCTATCTHTT